MVHCELEARLKCSSEQTNRNWLISGNSRDYLGNVGSDQRAFNESSQKALFIISTLNFPLILFLFLSLSLSRINCQRTEEEKFVNWLVLQPKTLETKQKESQNFWIIYHLSHSFVNDHMWTHMKSFFCTAHSLLAVECRGNDIQKMRNWNSFTIKQFVWFFFLHFLSFPRYVPEWQ